MEIFGRSPALPTSTGEWLVFVVVFAVIAIAGTRAADWSAAVFMLLVALAAYLFDSAIYIPLGIALAGVLAWAFRGNTAYPNPVRRTVIQGSICTAVFILYEIGRHLVKGEWSDARANSLSIISFEQRFNLDPERFLQKVIIDSDRLIHWTNSSYSWFFLPVVAGALIWLFIAEDPIYRRFRNSLAVSASLAILLISLFPVAPPRLMPESGLVGTHALMGGSHSFVNPYAAVPSLHVGWVALSGVALFFGVRHWMRWFWLAVPLSVMLFTVMSTGHHYLVDGLIGMAISVGPFLVLTAIASSKPIPGPAAIKAPVSGLGIGRRIEAAQHEIQTVPRVKVATYTLTALLTYMVVRQVVDPGFTHYWGYMVAQIAATIIVILWISVKFAPEGGFSWLTLSIVVITSYADTLGTAGHMYDRFITYDKVTHFLGTAAVASAAGDILLALRHRGVIDWSPSRMMWTAVAVAVALAAGWEVYEYLGDKLLDTGRHAGAVDTYYDLISDTAGAVTAAALLYWWHFLPSGAANTGQTTMMADPTPERDQAS